MWGSLLSTLLAPAGNGCHSNCLVADAYFVGVTIAFHISTALLAVLFPSPVETTHLSFYFFGPFSQIEATKTGHIASMSYCKTYAKISQDVKIFYTGYLSYAKALHTRVCMCACACVLCYTRIHLLFPTSSEWFFRSLFLFFLYSGIS